MSLADRLAQAPQRSTNYCSVGKALTRLSVDPPEKAALVAALENPQVWPATALAHTLQLEGVNVDIRHIRAHRMAVHTSCDWPDVGRAKP